MTTIDRPTPSAPTAPGRPTSGGAVASPARRGGPARPASPRKPGPVLVRQVRGGIEESVHRGDIVQVDVDGSLIRGLGDPDRVANLRSCVKPFGVVALIEAGGIEAFDLEPAELALMASSHSGEDLHVRTLQAMYRRAGVSQTLIATGSEGMPLDALTAARLARDGEKASPVRHMCSGQHSVFLLLSRLKGWDPEAYWLDGHPAQVAYQAVIARTFGDDAGEAPDLDRRLRRRDLRLPAPRDRPRLRVPRRPDGRARERPALVARAVAGPGPRRDARQSRDGRRDAASGSTPR